MGNPFSKFPIAIAIAQKCGQIEVITSETSYRSPDCQFVGIEISVDTTRFKVNVSGVIDSSTLVKISPKAEGDNTITIAVLYADDRGCSDITSDTVSFKLTPIAPVAQLNAMRIDGIIPSSLYDDWRETCDGVGV